MSIQSFYKRLCTDTAVYWGVVSGYAEDGTKVHPAPVEIDCFWVNETDVFVDNEGKEAFAVAKVYIKQDLDEEGMLYHGSLTDLSAAEKADPKTVKDAFEIKKITKKPSRYLKTQYARCAILDRPTANR